MTSHNETMLNAALKYRNEYGFSVIPIIQGKKIPCLTQWAPYQKQKPTEEEIKRWWGHDYPGANIAIITGEISDLTVIDIDTEEGKLKIEENTPESFLTPMVETPSGGEHRYCKYEKGVGNAVRFAEGCDIRSNGGYVVAPPSTNHRGKWKWHESCNLKKISIQGVPPLVLSLYNNSVLNNSIYKKETELVTSVTSVTSVTRLSFDKGARDNSLFHIANCLVKGGMPEQNIQELLSLIASNVCSPPYPQKDVYNKIKSALRREDTRDRNIKSEVLEWISVTKGYWDVTRCYSELQLLQRKEKTNVRVILHRLVNEGKLERDERRQGWYRRIENQVEEVDLNKVELRKGFDIRLPFFMEQYLEVMPKDLIVYAGEPNAGKTALMLETVRINMNSYKCYYFSTEMGRYNAKKRLAKHDSCFEWNFKFIDDFPNYFDVIKPDDFNFIDYVEVPDGEYYKIPSILAGIQKKLKTGLAFVALQKLPGRDFGVGGHQTLAKPALFCSLEPDHPGAIIKMVKVKNYIDANPNGFVHRFKIIKGINIMGEGSWEPEM